MNLRRSIFPIAIVGAILAASCSDGGSSQQRMSQPRKDSRSGTNGTPVRTSASCEISRDRLNAISSNTPQSTATLPSTRTFSLQAEDGHLLQGALHVAPTNGTSIQSPTVLVAPMLGTPASAIFESPSNEPAGHVGAQVLLGHGYNVVAWDSQGYIRKSDAYVDDIPEDEGRHVPTIVDWLAAQPEASLDATGDPQVGLIGDSFGGAVAYTGAGNDCRIDAIIPTIGWTQLSDSYYPNDVLRSAWAAGFSFVRPETATTSRIGQLVSQYDAHAMLRQDDLEWLTARDVPSNMLEQLQTPTLIIHGLSDTLVPPSNAFTAHRHLERSQSPLAMRLFCGGHALCTATPLGAGVLTDHVLSWLDTYVARRNASSACLCVTAIDQTGKDHEFANLEPTRWLKVSDDNLTTIQLTKDGGAGGAPLPPGDIDELTALTPLVVPAIPHTASRIRISDGIRKSEMLFGAPRIRLTYRSNVPARTESEKGAIFGLIVDPTRGLVLGNQANPIPLTLDGKTHTIDVELEPIVAAASADAPIELQLTGWAAGFPEPSGNASVDIVSAQVELPIGEPQRGQ